MCSPSAGLKQLRWFFQGAQAPSTCFAANHAARTYFKIRRLKCTTLLGNVESGNGEGWALSFDKMWRLFSNFFCMRCWPDYCPKNKNHHNSVCPSFLNFNERKKQKMLMHSKWLTHVFPPSGQSTYVPKTARIIASAANPPHTASNIGKVVTQWLWLRNKLEPYQLWNDLSHIQILSKMRLSRIISPFSTNENTFGPPFH